MNSKPVAVRDQFTRPLHDLRVSVLDRCNLRCTYCMPEESLHGKGIFLPKSRLLTDEEIIHVVSVFARLGVEKLRLTGGEPLLRPGLANLVQRLSTIEGIRDLAITTNAVLLPRLAEPLKQAGLHRITVSLDSINEDVFLAMSGGKGSVKEVLQGISAAEQAGFSQLKINTVVQKGVNDETVLELIDHFRGSGHTVRLIEFMDVGNLNHWSPSQVVPGADLLKSIHDRWPLRPLARNYAGETANRYTFEDGQGEVGFINSISQPFCGNCSRARITADGVYYSCLFSSKGTELRSLLRNGMDSEGLYQHLYELWSSRTDRYSENRSNGQASRSKVEMFRMGG